MEEKNIRHNSARPMVSNKNHHKTNRNHKNQIRRIKPEKEKKRINKKKIFNILTFIFAGLAHIALLLIVIWSIRFSGLELSTFIFLYIVLGLLLVINDVILFVGSKYRDFVIKCIACGLSILLLIGGIFGSSIVGRINSTASKVIQNTTKEQYETVNVTFVTYDNSSITSLSDLSNKKVGVIKSSSTGEDSTSVGKKKLESEGITVEYKEYDTLADTFMGLVNGEVDGAIMPSSYNALLSQNSSYEEPLKKVVEIESIEENVITGESSGYNKNLTIEPFTVLLIGYAQESENYGLADSVILCSVNPLTYQVAMVSLARDSYVPICGGGNDKLTHSRGQSRACLIQTVEDLMDEKVDFYMEINFQGVVDVVDALDGIVINNPVEFIGQSPSLERGNMTVWVPEGEFRANGEQALAFARERHAYLEGDFARQKHQQEVIKAIAEEIFELKDVNKALKVLDAAGKNFSTNFSVEQLTTLFNFIMKNGANTGVSIMNQMQIFNSRVTGYSSSHWNESAQLALWIYRLWDGSIKDNKWLIDKVMGTEDVRPQFSKFTFRYDAPFEETISFPDVYNEEQIHEQLPTTVPNLVGMTLTDVQTWASEAGVNLGINYVETTDTTLISKVKSQSVEKGTSLDDCGHYVTVEVYTAKVEKITVPGFTSIEEVQTWANKNGLVFATGTKETTDTSIVDGSYAGTNPAQGEQVIKGATITALTYKYVESSDKEACENSGGTYSSGTCTCPSGKTLEGKACVVSSCEHTWGDLITDVAATDCVDGSGHRVCTKCSQTQTEKIPHTCQGTCTGEGVCEAPTSQCPEGYTDQGGVCKDTNGCTTEETWSEQESKCVAK